MKELKKALLTAAILAGTYAMASAAPATLVAEGITPASDPGADVDPAWAALTIIPAPSNTDLVNGIVPVQIGSRTAHDGSAFNLAAMSDGQGDVAYPGNLPADYPGLDVPAMSMFWTFASPQDVAVVIAYCFNWNGGNGPDIRAVPAYSVYTTTDATPTAGGNWTLYISKAHTNVAPLNLGWDEAATTSPFGDTAGANGCAVLVGDSEGQLIGSALTGIRVDMYSPGFGNEYRNPANENTEAVPVGPAAVTAPFIAEIDVLAVSPFPSAVSDWMLY